MLNFDMSTIAESYIVKHKNHKLKIQTIDSNETNKQIAELDACTFRPYKLA